jgi:hypothetical protein
VEQAASEPAGMVQESRTCYANGVKETTIVEVTSMGGTASFIVERNGRLCYSANMSIGASMQVAELTYVSADGTLFVSGTLDMNSNVMKLICPDGKTYQVPAQCDPSVGPEAEACTPGICP